MQKPNMLLESDVQDELDWDPQVDDSRIVVHANDGRVTLSGAVPSYLEMLRAVEDVHTVGGVTGVDNELLVGRAGEAIDDGAIAMACAAALDADKLVPKGAVHVEVRDGYVTLTGEVRRHYQREAARFAVSRVDGVLGVNDNITLSSDPIPSDVADRIRKALQRNAMIDESAIMVSNTGHTIQLDGTVGSLTARDEAEQTAWDAPGVQDVVDNVQVVP
jgi:osmotically-inducible protein OsmY